MEDVFRCSKSKRLDLRQGLQYIFVGISFQKIVVTKEECATQLAIIIFVLIIFIETTPYHVNVTFHSCHRLQKLPDLQYCTCTFNNIITVHTCTRTYMYGIKNFQVTCICTCSNMYRVTCTCGNMYRVTCGMLAGGFSWHAGRQRGGFVVDTSMVYQEIPTEEASYLSHKSQLHHPVSQQLSQFTLVYKDLLALRCTDGGCTTEQSHQFRSDQSQDQNRLVRKAPLGFSETQHPRSPYKISVSWR